MQYISRDTYQDRLANFTSNTNRASSINNYLVNKIKVISFYNKLRRAMEALSKRRYTNNLRTETHLRRDLATTLLINLLDGTLVQPETALHTYLDDSTRKSALFS